jgi:Domain of Unknown Function (DUF748)
MSRPRGRWIVASVILSVLILAFFIITSLMSEPVRKYAEQEASARLPDYEITIGKVRLQPLKLGVDLQNVVVRLRANPDPPLVETPDVEAKFRLLPLFTGTVDLNFHIENPHLAATGQQVETVLHPQKKKEVVHEAVAWQDTLREMPIRVSLSISNGQMSYQKDPNVDSIDLRQLDVNATNVTNRSKDEEYPSELRMRANLPDGAQIELDSHANFLTKPLPRIDGGLHVQHFNLATLQPLTGQYNVQLRQGTVDMTGQVKYSSPTTMVSINDLLIEGAKADYVHTAQTKEKEVKRAKKGAEKVKEVHKDPLMVVKVSHGKILHSDVGFINKSTSPDYRVFLEDMNLELENFSNRKEEGMGIVKLTGNFMGSGQTVVTGTFRAEKPNPDFNVQVRIVKTKVNALNKLLEAYGHLNASQGTFAFFSDMTVKNNRIDGYVKPFLKDVEVYDPQQDQDKETVKKLYEAVVNGVLALFKSTDTDQVATETDVSGPVEYPNASTWQILEKLVQNAFFKAILPGFEHSKRA